MSETATSQPASASASAMARPRPRAAPVTRAILPCNSMFALLTQARRLRPADVARTSQLDVLHEDARAHHGELRALGAGDERAAGSAQPDGALAGAATRG